MSATITALSLDYCYDLYDRYAVPDPIRRHCEAVRKVGVVLANALTRAAQPVDVALVEAGCLIHDAMKAASLERLEANPQFGYDGLPSLSLTQTSSTRRDYCGACLRQKAALSQSSTQIGDRIGD